jgi:rsbT co-antagonist protein RsbR
MVGEVQPDFRSGPPDDEALRRRIDFVDLTPVDVKRISEAKDEVLAHLDAHLAAFFDYLQAFPEARPLFARAESLAEAKRLKRDHLVAMVHGQYGAGYVEQRSRLGQIYSRAGLPMSLFIGAFNKLLSSVGSRIMSRFAAQPAEGFACVVSFNKIGFFDLAIIVDAMVADREETIRRQQQAIQELSTPTLKVRDRLLILPIIGLLDSYRAKQLTDGLLQAIREHRAKVVVVDLTGVATVDSKVANHLIQTVAAARLMGAFVIITGLSADVAQSLVTLGVDLSSLNTMGDLQGGIEEAERLLAAPMAAGRPLLISNS